MTIIFHTSIFSVGTVVGKACFTEGCRISTTLKSEQMTFLFLISVLFGNRGGNGRLLYCGVQDQYYMETRTDDLFLFLISFLFGSRGWNGRLLYCGVQDQYCIEIRR
jgi:hypothetical protein